METGSLRSFDPHSSVHDYHLMVVMMVVMVMVMVMTTMVVVMERVGVAWRGQ